MKSIKEMCLKFKYAFEGLWHGVTKDASIITQLVITGLVVALSVYLKLNKYDFIIILGLCFIVLITEFLNSAIENLSDYKCDKNYSEKIKVVKDLGAGAVLVSSIMAVIIGSIIFYGYIF